MGGRVCACGCVGVGRVSFTKRAEVSAAVRDMRNRLMGNNVILISPLCDPYPHPLTNPTPLLSPILLGVLPIALDCAYKR